METLSPRLVSHFELLGTHAAEMAVAPRFIVEVINVVGHVGYRQFAVLVDLFLDPLLFETAEHRLGDGIVPAVPFAAHTRLQVIRAAESPPRVAAVLRALIGVNQRAASAHRHQRGVEHELAVNGALRGRSCDTAPTRAGRQSDGAGTGARAHARKRALGRGSRSKSDLLRLWQATL